MIEPFSAKDIEAMQKVENSKSSAFEDLVKAAGLNPLVDLRFCSLRGVDLRGSDLREFDLSGCDVEGAIISASTLLPNDERMREIRGRWTRVEERRSIVELMRAIEAAEAADRTNLLKKLIEDYDSDTHIDRFLLNGAKKARSSEVALDLFKCMSPGYVLENQSQIREQLKRILRIDERRPTSKRKVGAKDNYSFVSKLVEWIAESDMDDVADAASEYRDGKITLSILIDGL